LFKLNNYKNYCILHVFFYFRGVITVTPDGKRHVSLGRGYTLYEYPESYPKIEECISKVYEQRKNV